MIIHHPRDVLVERLTHFLPTRSHGVPEPWTSISAVDGGSVMLTQLLSLAKAAYDMRYFLCLALSAGVRLRSLFPLFFSQRSAIWTDQKKWLWWTAVKPRWLTFNWMIERGNSFIHQFLSIDHGQHLTSNNELRVAGVL